MSSSSPINLHSKRLPSETEHTQRIPDVEMTQQLRLRERQRFFEEVFQHDVDVYLSSSHLQVDYKRPPIGSISSMEVNVDMLEQMDLMDISDQEALDVFFCSSGEEAGVTSSLSAHRTSHNNNDDDEEDDEVISSGLSRGDCDGCDGKSRMSSTSSSNSQNTNEDGIDTPVVQSEDEDACIDTLLLMGTPPGRDEESDRPSSAT